MMSSYVLFGFLTIFIISCGGIPSKFKSFKEVWTENSFCSPEDSDVMCHSKKTQCATVRKLLSAPGGDVSALIRCSNTSGVVLGPEFFLNIGWLYATAQPENLVKMASSDSAIQMELKQCSLNATGLLNPGLTLNRTAVKEKLYATSLPGNLTKFLSSAIDTCPEPIEYDPTVFTNCLMIQCMEKVDPLALAIGTKLV